MKQLYHLRFLNRSIRLETTASTKEIAQPSRPREMTTPTSCIDLPSEPQIIEVERVGKWKSGWCQILLDWGFNRENPKPRHGLLPHSCHRNDRTRPVPKGQGATIHTSGLPFDATVSFEISGSKS